MLGATAEHLVATTEAVGVDPALPSVLQSVYDRPVPGGGARMVGLGRWTSSVPRDRTY